MKLLLCVASLKDVQDFISHHGITPEPDKACPFLFSAKILQHDVTIVETGYGIFQTSYKVTKALSLQKYHLALKIGFGNSYKKEIAPGTVLNIVNEKPGDFGLHENGEWKDLYDLGLLKTDDAPQQRGGFINYNNAYLNVFSPFKKAVGITVNHYADADSITNRAAKYKVDCETLDGLGFVYPCMFEKQGYYHLCVIENCLATGDKNLPLAIQRLNETLIDLLAKL